ncbi:MAG: hypothetical protein ACRDT6_05565 [Micromonosporaceae bacterium]
MTARTLLAAAAVALLLGGCGGAAPDAGPTGPTGGTSPSTPASGQGTLNVDQSGTAAPNTIWYVRIESMNAEPLTENGYPGQAIALSQQLDPGQYRVISWWRQCQSTCPTSGEQGLGPLEQVCGAVVTLAPGARVTATVVIGDDGGCTVRVPTPAASPS